MAENSNDIGGKVGLDITDFKTNISELNRQIKVIDSGFKAAAAGLGDWGASADGLQSRIKALSDITDVQKKKVEALTNEYKKVASEKGEDSKAAQDLLIRINKETESLNKNQKELQDVTVKLDSFGKEEDKASEKTNKFDGFLSKLGSTLGGIGGAIGKAAVVGITAISVAAAGAAIGAFTLASDAGKAADELITLSNKTGISTKQLQEMSYASRFVDVDLETMTGSMVKLTKSMDGARNGTKLSEEAFKKLGIEYKNQDGSLRDSKQVWTETITALGNVANETDRDALSLQLFGKSAQELNPLIKAGADELNRLGVEANKVGAVLSEEALQSAGKFDDMMQTLDASMKGLTSTIGIAAIPAITEVVNSVVGIVPKITESLKTGDWVGAGKAVTDGINGLLSKVTNALPGLTTMATTIIGGLATTIVTAIPQILPPLIQATLMLLNTLISTLTQNGPMLITAGISALMMLINGLITALPQLVNAAIILIMALVNGLIDNNNLQNLLNAAIQIVFALVDGILKLLPELIPAAIKLILALTQGLIDNLPKLIEKVPQIMETIVKVLVENLPLLANAALQIIIALTVALIDNLPLIIESAIKIIGALASGIIENISTLLSVVPKLFRELNDAFVNIDWAQLGLNIINGIVEGVKSAAKSLANSVVNAAKNALSSTKSFLGIQSPSTVMRDQVGAMIGAGMAEGITESSKEVNAAMRGLNKQLTSDAINMSSNINVNGKVAGNSVPNQTNSIDYIKLGAIIADGLAEAFRSMPQQTVDFNIDGTKLSRALFPKLILEEQRLGLVTK